MLSKVANIRMHLLSAPYVKAFNVMKDGGDLGLIHFNQNSVRAGGGLGAVFIKTAPGLVTVIHALSFPDETDTAIARVMMQMFAKEGKKVGVRPRKLLFVQLPVTEYQPIAKPQTQTQIQTQTHTRLVPRSSVDSSLRSTARLQ